MSFCPLLSTAEKKVECQEDCMWHLKFNDGTEKCEISYISDRLDEIKNSSDTTASGILNKCF